MKALLLILLLALSLSGKPKEKEPVPLHWINIIMDNGKYYHRYDSLQRVEIAGDEVRIYFRSGRLIRMLVKSGLIETGTHLIRHRRKP